MKSLELTEGDFREVMRVMECPGFVIDWPIFAFAYQLAAEEMRDIEAWSDCRIPADAIRHSDIMLFAMPVTEKGDKFVCYCLSRWADKPAGDPESGVTILQPDGFMDVGYFAPSGQLSVKPPKGGEFKDREGHDFSFTVLLSAFLLSLINQPRIVRKAPLLSRQQRRAEQRGGNLAVDSWHRVTWDLSKETVAKASRDESFHKMPLHWRRGHFRRAESHFRNAVQRPDAIRPSEREGWWQWIDGLWVGHPAFGLKIGVHAPKMTSGRLAIGKGD